MARRKKPLPGGAMRIEEALAYAKNMERLHGDKWLVFRVPEGSLLTEHVRRAGYHGVFYHCCRAKEEGAYKQGGAVFVDPLREPMSG